VTPAIAHEADIHREFVMPGGELARAVQRIDQPELGRGRGDAPAGDLLLRDHGYVRRCGAQAGDDQRLGGVIRFGDRGAVLLAFHIEAAGAHLQDGFGGLLREAGNQDHQIIVVHPSDVAIERG
jgi:hypothetical protein